jgi:hypothetical protein
VSFHAAAASKPLLWSAPVTQEQWLTVLSPIISAVVMAAASLLALALSGLTTRLKTYLEAKGHAELSAVVQDASERAQAAMQNAAGQIALEIQAGRIAPTDIGAMLNAALKQAEAIEHKIPDALAVLKPAPGAVAGGIMGKITTALPAAPAVSAPAVVAPASQDWGGTFQERAKMVLGRLMADLGITREQAAGIVGNLGQESGLQAINEIKPVCGRGGFGWAQWTGPRRLAFEQWASSRNLQVTDPEANYGYLLHELNGPERAALDALRQTTTVEEATQVFEERFERAGVVSMGKRVQFANLAMVA